MRVLIFAPGFIVTHISFGQKFQQKFVKDDIMNFGTLMKKHVNGRQLCLVREELELAINLTSPLRERKRLHSLVNNFLHS